MPPASDHCSEANELLYGEEMTLYRSTALERGPRLGPKAGCTEASRALCSVHWKIKGGEVII